MNLKRAACALMLVSITACASGPKGRPDGPGGGAASVLQPSSLLAKARDTQALQGCAAAAPAYRIVASYGEGFEVAQYELGACLLEMNSDDAAETALLRQESLFWLSRAAWAGNPRAQGKLAEILSGAPLYQISAVSADPEQAMMWAIVYTANGVRDTFGLKPLSAPVSNHLSATLTPVAMQNAQARADAFHKIELASFKPPQIQQGDEARTDRARRPSGGQGRPQRR